MIEPERLAAETAMKRLRAKLDAVDAQFPLEGEAEKSLKGKLIIETEKQLRIKYHRSSKVNDAIAATDLFFVCIYIDYNEQEALLKEKRQEKEEDRYRGASGQLYTAARGKLFHI